MDSLLIDRLRKTNKKVHNKIVEWFSNSDYQADAYVNEILSQLSRSMRSHNTSDTDLAKTLGVNKSAVSQFFDSDGNIKVKTLFKYINAAGLSLKPPVLTKVDSEKVYQNFLDERKTDKE